MDALFPPENEQQREMHRQLISANICFYRKYHCNVEKRPFGNWKALKEHNKMKRRNVSYNCKFCDHVFESTGEKGVHDDVMNH